MFRLLMFLQLSEDPWTASHLQIEITQTKSLLIAMAESVGKG